ncbi:MAG: exonuclease V [Alphaproteobacteria bacterium]|nr:exonuclease V [Alphaproteobacteria bacterium]
MLKKLSLTGLTLSGLYLASALWVIYDALTCQSMLCGLTGVIITLPSWAVLWLTYQGLDTLFAFGFMTREVENFLMFPAALINAGIIYFLGKLVVWVWNKIAY